MIWTLAALTFCFTVPGIPAEPTSAPVDRQILLDPSVYPEGVTDETEYEAWLKQEAARLTSSADAESASERDRIESSLALANWLLAIQAEPAATRIVLGLEHEGDRAVVRRIAESAMQRLDAAREHIDAYHPADAAAADDSDEAWEETRTTLDVFARGLAAVGESGDDAKSSRRRAAVAFALYVDDSRRQVALYARLWQGVLLLESGEADRAVRSLKPTLEPMADPFPEFFLRVVRVRAAVSAAPETDAGRFATGIALLLRLEERCEQVFDSPSDARLAEQTCGVIRADLARQWQASLASHDKSAAATAVGDLASDVREGDGPVEILRLRHAVPVLMAAGGATPESEPAVKEESKPAPEDEMGDQSEDDGDDAGDDDAPPPEK